MMILSMPHDEFRLGDALIAAFDDARFSNADLGVAFAKISGVKHLEDPLRRFLERGGHARITLGIDQCGTSKDAVSRLLEITSKAAAEFRIFHNENASTFHPKLYLFYGEGYALLFAGSSNLTEGGLFTNYEVGTLLELNLTDAGDRSIFDKAKGTLDAYASGEGGLSVEVDSLLIERLSEQGQLPSEAELSWINRSTTKGGDSGDDLPEKTEQPVFPRVSVPPAPHVAKSAPAHIESEVVDVEAQPAVEVPAPTAAITGFVMTLMQTDAGRGQTTPGAAARSPEVFVPLAARDANPGFWGWPARFVPDATNPGKMDRPGVVMRLGGTDIEVNMMTWPAKSDFRLRSRSLIEEMHVGDILRLELVGGTTFEYYAEIVPQGTTLFGKYDALCSNAVRNSKKRWGYY